MNWTATMSWTKAWLAVAKRSDDPEGDLIADMARDPNIPILFHNIESMRAYLHDKGACREAIAAVPRVWRRYRRWTDRHPTVTNG